MKICWDNLKDTRLTKNGLFRHGRISYIYKEHCARCGEPYLTINSNQSEYCCKSCAFKERKFSEETKLKMSKSASAKKLSEGHKNNISKSMIGKKNHFFGKKHSVFSRKKISDNIAGKNCGKENHFYGKSHKKSTLIKISEANKGRLLGSNNPRYGKGNEIKGDRNPNWRGGISCEPYCINWTRELKEYVKERDGYRCLNPECLKTSAGLVVHHINYNKKDCRLSNLVTVCASCNAKANFNRRWHKSWYQAIMKKRYGGNA